ncbi:translational GTPase TypA [Longimicrobium sp.]|uniref:translational GTPase TypA n=1 Tax=Longimicrobium sp. TaxID=2029185 RepID=UPI002CC42CCD|nr:translational GTPase TypA [Longimicrobium sp.]HSU13591.1 translational GTPase TypA [Longimicrobium sp.]
MQIRNIAIIAHVDHGKTTLVDHMLRQAGTFRENQQVQERVMDSNPLERERGITILAKNLSVRWHDTKVNIVDTPGHSDFGGEVERILRMVDGVVLLVDAAEGPMPQTRFVTRKAMELGLQPIVIINKIDRGDADPHRVHDEVLELFMELEADDHQLDCPFLYAVGREGVAMRSPEEERKDLTPLFETILETIPAPRASEGPFQMLVSTIDYSPYLGRLAIGKIERGTGRVGDTVVLVTHGDNTAQMTRNKISKLYTFDGLERHETESASAGDVVALAGLTDVEIGATVCDAENPDALEGIAVEEPTVSVDIMLNNSPFAGREGKYVTSRQVRDRLFKELESNVALRVEETDSPDTLTVSGRGELHLGILMETMRREGYEFAVSRPRVILKKAPDGQLQEPYEEVTIDLPETHMGPVIEKMGQRRAEMLEMRNPGGGLVRLVYKTPARALFGYRSEFLTDTRGEGTLHHRFLEYGPFVGSMNTRSRGVLVSMMNGEAVAFSLGNLQERSTFFIEPGVPVYEGMIVGENSRPGDMEVNVTRGKKLTNMRASGSDDNILLEPPKVMTLEDAMGYIADDELIEVTPKSLRLRKRLLNANDRKKASRAASA